MSLSRFPNWKPDEDELLRKWYPEKGSVWDRWDELLPGRSPKGIQDRAHKIGVRCRYSGPKTAYTKSMDRVLLIHLQEMCQQLDRSPKSVVSRLDHILHEQYRKRRVMRDAGEGQEAQVV